MKIKLLWPALLCGLSFNALAQAGPADGDEGGPGGPPRWSLGLGAIAKDGAYAGEGSQVMPIPLVNYNGDRFFFRGITAGWKLVGNEAFELNALGKLRFDGFSVDDLGRSELARNGIDRTLLEDRDKALDLGIGAKWTGRAGELELELLADVTDKSGGQEATLQYGYPFQLGIGSITPMAGVTWQSKDMANYYYGTLDSEVARGVVDYKPGAVTLPFVGVQYFRPIGEKWSVMAFAKYSRLPSALQDSPLVEADKKNSATIFVGFSRGF
ncbi:MipA/OmpV family protein [Stenotrophomonas sp. 24(2023)]|uniref:MipA/OmpV family protein n=1 Tax=Stenotrophomonas sp. 24(2023) TaxID=3068324 RepID=UPI0027E04217|nr:MipA/OmpV family protein [Stenotrophomonas sp. 24(2023)]WMJ68215.1 MipA/OmpV family protein [Stenotrophomonas sp. 24(2023)]